MKASLDKSVSALDRLAERLDELESRVATLEHRAEAHLHSTPARAAMPEGHPLAQIASSSNVMPVIGKVFLGMAGAYLLRALAESGAMPKWAVACVALAYAGSWLLWAARTPATAVFAGTAYAATAAVILPPMLWELTLRFNVMPASVTATVLVGFVALATALAWSRRFTSVALIPTVSAAIAAGLLLVAAREPLPFTVALLLIALITEAAATTDRWPSLRPLVAIPVDLALLALIAIYTSSNGPSPDYKSLTSAALLGLFAAAFVIYMSSVLSRTLVLRRQISVFEIGQTVAVFLLASFGSLRTTHGSAAPALGVACLLAAAAFYWLSFRRFQDADSPRNHHVFSTWAVALVLSGSFLYFPASANVIWLGAAALAATFAGLRSGRPALALHGALYLAAVMLASGLLQYCASLLMGAPPPPGAWPVWAACLFTAICYALAWRSTEKWRGANGPMRPRPGILCLPFAAMAACATLAAALTAGLLAFPVAGAARVAAARTLMMCLLALLLGWSGSRWRRTELIWLAYAFMALCTLKLLGEDLRTGSAGAIAFSLFCYGMIWVLVPRFARARKPN